MKNLSTAFLNALQSRRIVPRFFMQFYPVSGVRGFWNDVGDVAFGGVTYRGTGTMISVSSTAGVDDMSIPGLTVELSPIDSDVIDAFMANEIWHQQPMTVSIGLLSPDTKNLVDTPDTYFDGYMDQIVENVSSGGKSGLTLSCEDVSVRMTDTFAFVRSDADQRERDPTDTFMKNVTVAASRTLFWGQATPPGFYGSSNSNNSGNNGQRPIDFRGGLWGAIRSQLA